MCALAEGQEEALGVFRQAQAKAMQRARAVQRARARAGPPAQAQQALAGERREQASAATQPERAFPAWQ